MKASARRWLPLCAIFVAAAATLVWAYPRYNAANRLRLVFDREGYLARARSIASRNGVDLRSWRGYVQLDTQTKNQNLHRVIPGNETAREFPAAEVDTNFLPPEKGASVKIILRPDGRPLSWKFAIPKAAPATPSPDADLAQRALIEMAGIDAAHFVPAGKPSADLDGVVYRWRRNGPETPEITIEAAVRNGRVWRTATNFSRPPNVNPFENFTVLRVIFSTVWVILLVCGFILPLFRERGSAAARALKDPSALRFTIAATLCVGTASLLQWDDSMVSLSAARGIATEVLSLILGTVMVGLFFYVVNTSTALNAPLHVGRVRTYRLAGTPALFSSTTGKDMLTGWLVSPTLVAIPLLVAALLRATPFKDYDDSFVLCRLPVLDALAGSISQDTVGMIAFLGVLIPLAFRWFAKPAIRLTCIGVFAVLTISMLDAPFRVEQAPNLLDAALYGGAMLWLYFRYGVLASLSAHVIARVLNAACVLLIQPAAGLHASGWNVLLAFACLGMVCLATAWKGPEAVAELYGGAPSRIQARSRREELLAEFTVARSAQQQMLPSTPPEIAGYSIAASCEPAREVGGDLYDFLRLRDGRWGIGVADVSGKGVPAALYMTLTKGLLCAAAQATDDPRQILASVNKHLRTVTKRKMFVTMAMGVLNPEARTMEYVRAGHNPVVWRRRDAGETRLLSGAGIGLGIAGPALFGKTLVAETLDLAPGDALVFYSDGLTEAMNVDLEQFGEERLLTAVESADGLHATDTRDSILKEVKAFLQGGHSQDDLTIAVLRVNSD